MRRKNAGLGPLPANATGARHHLYAGGKHSSYPPSAVAPLVEEDNPRCALSGVVFLAATGGEVWCLSLPTPILLRRGLQPTPPAYSPTSPPPSSISFRPKFIPSTSKESLLLPIISPTPYSGKSTLVAPAFRTTPERSNRRGFPEHLCSANQIEDLGSLRRGAGYRRQALANPLCRAGSRTNGAPRKIQ